jgi:hypothetical protein
MDSSIISAEQIDTSGSNTTIHNEYVLERSNMVRITFRWLWKDLSLEYRASCDIFKLTVAEIQAQLAKEHQQAFPYNPSLKPDEDLIAYFWAKESQRDRLSHRTMDDADSAKTGFAEAFHAMFRTIEAESRQWQRTAFWAAVAYTAEECHGAIHLEVLHVRESEFVQIRVLLSGSLESETLWDENKIARDRTPVHPIVALDYCHSCTA